jgi:hypothetical protein
MMDDISEPEVHQEVAWDKPKPFDEKGSVPGH